MDSRIEIALRFARQGWKLIPQTKAKTPPKGFTDWPSKATSDVDTLRTWAKKYPQANFAVMTGAESGIVVVDIDVKGAANGLDSWRRIQAEFADFPETFTVATPSGGQHVYFKHPGGEIPSTDDIEDFPGVEIKADGHRLITLAGSFFPDGREYRILQDVDIAPIPLGLLEIAKTARKPKATPQAETAGTIPEGRRNKHLLSLAGTMRKRGMSATAILAALQAENELQCTPPLTEREVKGIAESIGRYSGDGDGETSQTDKERKRLEPTTADLEILAQGLTAEQLDAKEFPPISWIIPGLMTEGLTVLAGKSGSGKSYMVLQLACCLSAGAELFGKFPTKRLKVVYLSMEDDIRIAQQRRRECKLPKTKNLRFYETWPTGAEGLRLLEIYCAQQKPDLVIIDTWSWFRGAQFATRMNSDGYHEVVQELKCYKEAAKRAGTSILITHHLNKNPAGTGDPHDAILGSTAIRATCDTRLTLEYKADKSERTLHVQGRMIPTQAHVLNLGDEGWSYVSDREEYAQTTERQEIIDLLHPTDPMSPRDIADALDKNRSTVRWLLTEMERDGAITRKGHGRYVRT